MKKNLIILALTLFCAHFQAQAYTVSPACPDFTDINASYTEAFTGNTYNPFASQGVVAGRHTVISAPGTDLNTGGALQLLPAGESSVVRLGNEQVGAQAEALTYHFIVDKNNPVLLLKFAVVLEDPDHDFLAQPRFVVRITDKDGNLIEDCAEYDVTASADIPGFQTYNHGYYSSIRWRDWTNVGLDMSRFIGKEVQVQFVTYDCAYYGHFGYAYFTAKCIPNTLKLEACSGTEFTVAAPENFESYLWDNGETTRTSTRKAAENNSSLTCTVTSATGCQFPLFAYITSTSVSQPAVIYDTVCEGDTYNKNYFDLPEQNETGLKLYYNTFLNIAACNTAQTTELQLTVIPRYTRYKVAICQGESYKANGFDIVEPAVGVRRDTIYLNSSNGNCYTRVTLELTVSPSFKSINKIDGDASPCTGILTTYSFAGAELLTKFKWNVPANAVVVGKADKPQITLYFTDATPATLTLSGENGCGNGSVSLNIKPRQTYNVFLTDSVCTGADYDRYGFRLGVQNETGYYVHTHDFKSKLGCDSTVVLALSVFPPPTVSIMPKDPVLCYAGEEITLYAQGNTESMKSIPDSLLNCQFTGRFLQSDTIIDYYADGKKITTITTKVFIDVYCDTARTLVDYLTNPEYYNVMLDSIYNYVHNDLVCDSTLKICVEQITHIYTIRHIPSHLLVYTVPTVPAENTDILYAHDCTLDYLWNTGSTESAITVSPPTTEKYTVTVTNSHGCSASASVPVVVKGLTPSVVYDTICEGETYSFYGDDYTAQGVYTKSIAAEDCTIDAELHLTVNQKAVRTIKDVVCYGQPYTAHGLNLNFYQAGTVRDTLHLLRTTGCDSTVYLEITVLPARDSLLRDTVCQADVYAKNGFSLPAQHISGLQTYTRNTVTTQGCDSTVTLKLLVQPLYNNIISDEDSINNHYQKYGFDKWLTMHDLYSDTLHLKSTSGCDSTVILNVKILQPPCSNDTTVIKDTIFVNQSYNKNGFSIPAQNEAKSRIDTLPPQPNQAGCDSIVILKLEVLPAIIAPCQNDTVIIKDTIFVHQPYNKNGFSIPAQNEAKSRIDTLPPLPNQAGCDSIVILYLEVKAVVVPPPPPPPCDTYYDNIRAEIKEGEKYIFNGQELRTEGLYSETLVASDGCDSILVLYLSVLPKNACPEIEIPLFFSPNSDGFNDFWKIKNIDCYKYKIYLYDRFSKELFVWENNFPVEGWNGMYLGKPMSSTDYWYLITLTEVGRDFVGHFTLLR